MRYIKGVKDKPFFVYLAPNVTHLPLKVADHYTKHHLANGVNEKLAVFYGMVDNLDENVGRLSAFLKQEGLDENTIILFTTDDGTQGAAISQTEKPWFKGMRGKKGSRKKADIVSFVSSVGLRAWTAGTMKQLFQCWMFIQPCLIFADSKCRTTSRLKVVPLSLT